MRSSLQKFGEACLKIKTKDKKIVSFKMNTAQIFTHNIIEEEIRKRGRVRALVLKGRQQGISTYVAARYYHKAAMNKATNVYILSHEQKATDNLFDMVDRYHSLNPLAPVTGADSAKELEFEKLDSSYAVATAGKKAGGRGRTPHLFHGSEVAFWANAGDHFAASVQGVPDIEGSEVILESTANGPTGEFYERWQEAEAGTSDYLPIFIPWYWQEEYYREPELDFELHQTAEEGQMSEVEYAETFELSLGKMAWRRAKMRELRSYNLFDQEYPATAQMAFVNSNVKSFILGLDVLRARKRTIEGAGPLIMGADPAGPGGDRFAIAGRRGHAVPYLKWRNKIGTLEAYWWCVEVILKYEPARFNVDAGGIGAAVLSMLRENEDIPKNIVKGINFGARSQFKHAQPQKPGPKNRRAEMWLRSKQWLQGEEPVSLPDLDVLQADATGCQLKSNLTNDIQLESKEDMRARGVRSPDLWDAIALTFASTVHIENYVDKPKGKVEYGDVDKQPKKKSTYRKRPAGSNGWMS
tara:strand:+ start:4721 stop:6295 length:1575 start_codon:yes stop_codon:yes gene_type:complete